MSQNLEHFIRLAARGQSPAASGGEARAWAIAAALVENTPGLDESAAAGIGELAELIGNESWLDWDEIKARVLKPNNMPEPGND
jgi:hypothetical protein